MRVTSMRLPQPLVQGYFVCRLKRFAVLVRLKDGREVVAHLPNSGRLQEVLKAGNEMWLIPRFAPQRRTDYDVLLSRDNETLVCVDARLPPQLLLEGIAAGKVRAFGKVLKACSETPLGNHRLDLHLTTTSSEWWVETKSVTLVCDGVALFPDAPTVRGQEHLRLLADLQRTGSNTAVVFVIQRPDARLFAPHREADPIFAEALWAAASAGVRVLAYRCQVTMESIAIVSPVPVRL